MTQPDDTSQQFQVRTNPHDGSPARVLFQGTEQDARQFVEDHFPRIHVEPGALYPDDEGPQPDAVMVKPGSGPSADRTVYFDGLAWTDQESSADVTIPDTEQPVTDPSQGATTDATTDGSAA